MEDPSFGLKGIHVANVILEYFYIGLLIMCFILALGNRPQGSKWTFTLAFVGFAILTSYMTVRKPQRRILPTVLMLHHPVRRHIHRVQGHSRSLTGEGRPYLLRCLHGLPLQKHCNFNRCDDGLVPDFLADLRTKFRLASVRAVAD